MDLDSRHVKGICAESSQNQLGVLYSGVSDDMAILSGAADLEVFPFRTSTSS